MNSSNTTPKRKQSKRQDSTDYRSLQYAPPKLEKVQPLTQVTGALIVSGVK